MKAKIAVITVSGKAYYLVVQELKKRDVPFLSLTPQDRIPVEIKVIITTEEEKHLINHDQILTFKEGGNPEALITQAMRLMQGKESYDEIVIGIDPGKIIGLAVLADGEIVETENSFSIQDTLNHIQRILGNFQSDPTPSISIKIGDGVPKYQNKLLRALDKKLPPNVVLQSVSETGTNHYSSDTKHRRGIRDIVSAVKIAGRKGRIFKRRNTDGSYG